ncbi:FKBP-type peptidyl-prolyl cis-trans isomerase [Aquisalinus flavus]|uniref:peptidylprolyl isomerase n=1 Tax=Aquisalinus flavus TaxID=1526572 RepID=A0A8J2V5B3_9PROT|nr:FKBP-type peptidyl-prolyl cis-trans isomerase [Aquisalinus flavus]MBD0426193.1 FKBP-type peptidyl-prolyl cis-trans isomerase [Aquisalinus flavus]UNE48233.1 hypothetical protein FF099_09295 [Aquisalinus flavus]GGD09855.1 hypothetical protein GCM10011342_18450 [Aquisalinus flavus]
MSFRELLLAGVCAVALAACGNDAGEDAADTAETDAEGQLAEVPNPDALNRQNGADQTDAERSAAAAAGLEEANAFLAENAERDGVVVTESGVQVRTLTQGDGVSPTEEDYVTMHYTARHADGEVFDSSLERDEPVMESLGVFMTGLREGVKTMQQGGRAEIVIPPALAFGEAGTPDGEIGPNEAVVFEVELLDVTTVDELQQRFDALVAEKAAEAQAFLDENAAEEGVMATGSGLQYQVVEKGNGTATPDATDIVEVHYRGTLLDGTVFDSSYDRGETIEFPLNRVIPGWTEGLQLMSEGDTYRFFIPPALAYGPDGNGRIGPNEVLVFDVELIDVKEPPATPDEPASE